MRRPIRLRRGRDAAQVGLATLGLLAGGLVAATAAVQVLAPAPGGGEGGFQAAAEELAKQFLQVGADAADRLSPQVEPGRVYGRIQGEERRLDALNVTARAPASAGAVDLSQLVVRLSDGTRERWLAHGGPAGFHVGALRDADRSLAQAPPLLGEGDLASLDLDLRPGAADFALGPRTRFTLELVPPKGPPQAVALETPASFGEDRVFTLR